MGGLHLMNGLLQFPIGTRVVAVDPKWLTTNGPRSIGPHRSVKPGMTGTVSGGDPMNPGAVCVRWDVPPNRHDGDHEIYIWADGLEVASPAPIHNREELETWLDS